MASGSACFRAAVAVSLWSAMAAAVAALFAADALGAHALGLPASALAGALLVLTGGLAVMGLLRGGRVIVTEARVTERVLRAARALPRLRGAAHPAVLAPSTQPFVFCVGLWRPVIVVSTAAAGALAPTELDAVLEHEAHHARRRDPLRRLVLRALRDTLFFLPLVGWLAQRFETAIELEADHAAAPAPAQRRALAGALLVLTEKGAPEPEALRVDNLVGEVVAPALPAVALLAALSASGAMFGSGLLLAAAAGHVLG